MATPTVSSSVVSNPGGTGNTLTITLASHAVNQVVWIWVNNTGSTLWGSSPNWGLNQSGWSRKDQRAVGTSSNGMVGTLFYRRVLASDTLPLTNPVATLGATVTRDAISFTTDGVDPEGVFVLFEWSGNGHATGTANPIRPPSVTTPLPNMLVIHCYGQRAATNAPEPTGYTQLTNGEVIISSTLVTNVSQKTVADPQTVLSNQDVSPTSGARWVAAIICIPSPDYVTYRSGTQALQSNSTNVVGTLPPGTSSNDWRGNKDVVKVVVEAAGNNIAIAPQVPADWTEITGFAANTSGNGTTVRQYWAYYDGSLNLQFNRPTSGEIAICVTTYRNCDQTNPIGGVVVQQNASATTSAWPALARTETKSTVTATCVADGTPSYTVSAMTERMDGNGIVCADRVYDAAGTVPSASFTLSTASPTACGLVELLSVSGVAVPTFTYTQGERRERGINRGVSTGVA